MFGGIIGAGLLIVIGIVAWILVKRNNPEKAALAEDLVLKAADKAEAAAPAVIAKVEDQAKKL